MSPVPSVCSWTLTLFGHSAKHSCVTTRTKLHGVRVPGPSARIPDWSPCRSLSRPIHATASGYLRSWQMSVSSSKASISRPQLRLHLWAPPLLIQLPFEHRPHSLFFFSSLAERAITAVPVTALQKEAIETSSAMPRIHQAETKQTKEDKTKSNQAKQTTQNQPNTNQSQTPEWKQSSLFLYNIQLK